jgi:sugar phosphate isomerase/epimerase
MILGLASPTYMGGFLPATRPLSWLLDRCAQYRLRALEAPLPLGGEEDAQEVGRRATDAGVQWVGYWSDAFVDPDGGAFALRDRARRAFDVAERGGCRTLVIFGSGARHNRFMREPPLAEQLRAMAGHLGPIAEEAGRRALRLGLLPHLDYRAGGVLGVIQQVDEPALRAAFDTANAFPVCEEPVEAARLLAPHTIADRKSTRLNSSHNR